MTHSRTIQIQPRDRCRELSGIGLLARPACDAVGELIPTIRSSIIRQQWEHPFRATVVAPALRDCDQTKLHNRRGCRGSGSRTGAPGPMTGLSGGSCTGGGGSSPGGTGIDGGSSSLRILNNCISSFSLRKDTTTYDSSPSLTCPKFSTVTSITPPRILPLVASASHCR